MGLGPGWVRPPGRADHCPPVDAVPQVQTQGTARFPPGLRAVGLNVYLGCRAWLVR